MLSLILPLLATAAISAASHYFIRQSFILACLLAAFLSSCLLAVVLSLSVRPLVARSPAFWPGVFTVSLIVAALVGIVLDRAGRAQRRRAMSRPSRLRWVAKWGGMVGCVLTVFAYATTMRWYSVGVNSGKNYAIALGSGAVRVYWVGRWLPGFTPLTAMKPGRWARLADGTRIRDGWLREAWWPESYFQAGLRWVSIPLWMPLIGFAIPTVLLFRLDRRCIIPGHCPCGYDLTGNVSGVCPECGAEAD